MKPRDHDLLQLLRLRDRALASDDETALRERLVAEPRLRQLWQQIESTADRTLHDDVRNLWQVAAAWDRQEGLTPPETGEAGGWCGDFAALDRAARETGASAVPEHVVARLQSELSARLSEAARASTADISATLAVPSAEVQAYRNHRRLGLAAAGVLVAAAGLALWIPSRFGTEPPRHMIDTPTEVVSDQRPASTDENRHPDDENLVPAPLPEPPRTAPQIVRTPPVRDLTPTRAPEPKPDRPQPAIQKLRWERTQGIVAQFEPVIGRWAPASTHTLVVESTSSWRTLGGSWGTAALESGEQLTLGPETFVRIEFPNSGGPAFNVLEMSGEVGLRELKSGTTFTIEDEHGRFVGEIRQDGTDVVMEVSAVSMRVLVLEGTLRWEGNDVSRSHAIRFPSDARPYVENGPAALSWLDRPQPMSLLERHIAGSLNDSQDLVASLMSIRPGQKDVEQQTAATWGIELDLVQALPVAVNSLSTGQRLAAMNWLASPKRSAAETALATTALQSTLTTTLAIGTWYRAARGEIPLTAAIVQELAHGVAPSESLFVRHTAIEFLRKITGQKLTSYDPAQPSRSAISEVRMVARQWISQMP